MDPSKPTTSCRKRKKSPIQSPKNKVAKKSAADPTDANKKENGRGLKDTVHGVVYQLKLLMLYSYCCNIADYSFKLYTEMSGAEKFDDVVLEYFINNVQGYIFLQAKHSLDENVKITCANLKAKTNRFFLNKYFTSYVKIKRNDEFKNGHKHFIINTNLGFKFDDKSDKVGFKKLDKLYFESYDINSNINKSNKIFDLFNVGGEYYKLKDSVETLKCWFGKTTDFKVLAELLAEFLVNKRKIDFTQSMFKEHHSVLVGVIIDCKNEKLADNFIKNESLSSEAVTFRNAVLQEVKETHKKKITDFLREMASNGSIDLSFKFKEEPESNNKPIFPDQVVSEKDVEGFMNDCIFAVNQPNEKKLGDKINLKMGQSFSLVSSNLASDRYTNKILDWLKEKSSAPLTQLDIRTILENTDVEFTAIKTSGQSILLIDGLEDYGLKFKKEALSEELLNFVKSSDQAAQKRICILQNSDTLIGSLKVNQALREISKINDDFIFTSLTNLLLEQKMVMKTLKNEKMRLLIVVCEPQDKDVTELYNLLSEHLQNSNQRLLLIGAEKHPLIESFSSPNPSFVIKQNNCISDFTKDSQQTILKKKVFFQKHEILVNQLVDIQQKNIINLMLKSGLLENKTENIGDEIPISIGYNTVYYIERNFQKKTKDKKKPDLISTQDLLDQLKEDTHKKFVLISNSAGMGKSTVLTHLSLEIKKANPHFWVVRIDLNANTEAFIKHKNKLASDNVVEFIVDKLLKLKDGLEKDLFEHVLKKGRVVFILDAFDEICPSYEKKGIKFFKILKNINLRQLWITTRPYFKYKKNKKLSLDKLFSGDEVELLAITPFTDENQIDFLQKFWSQDDRFDQSKREEFAHDLIYKLVDATKCYDIFARFPLHLVMLAEVYKPDVKEIKFDLFSLYQKFFEKKIFINQEKSTVSLINDAKAEIGKAVLGKLQLWENYEHLAIECIFPNHANKILKKTVRKSVSSKELTRSGIVEEKGKGPVRFVHRTFAEFFAVKFIMKEFILNKDKKTVPNKFLQKFLLTEILCEFKYEIIRKFLNGRIKCFFKKKNELLFAKKFGKRIKKAYYKKLKKEKDNMVLYFAVRENNLYIIRFLSDNLKRRSCRKFSKSFIKCYMDSAIQCVYEKIDDGDDDDGDDSTKTLDELFAWINNFKYPIDNHPLLKLNDVGYSPWTTAILKSHLHIMKKIWDYFKYHTKFSNADLKSELLLSKVEGEYSVFLIFSDNKLDVLKYLWQFAEETGAQQELLQCKNRKGRTIIQLLLIKIYCDYNLNRAFKVLREINRSPKQQENNEGDIEQVSWVKDNSSSFTYKTDGDQTIFYHAANNSNTKTVDEIWRISNRTLNQNELQTILHEIDEPGFNKSWLLEIFQYNGSPSEMALQLWTDTGLENDLYQKLFQTDNSLQTVEPKEEFLSKTKLNQMIMQILNHRSRIV